MPRPLKYTPARAGTLCALLEAGCTRKAAAAGAGVSEDTFARWLAGRQGAEGFGSESFADRVRMAEARCGVRMTGILVRAAEAGDFRAALAWLELFRPEEWAINPYRDRRKADRDPARKTDAELIREAGGPVGWA